MRVGILDLKIGNLGSICNALKKVGADYFIVDSEANMSKTSHLIMPGVGNFGAAANQLRLSGADRLLKNHLDSGGKILGICLGFHLLGVSSDEALGVAGLSLIYGKVEKLHSENVDDILTRVPHMGFNSVNLKTPSRLLQGLSDAPDFYFTHSYAFKDVHIQDSENVLATTPFGSGNFISHYESDQVFGVQYHPEKSQAVGLLVLENYLFRC